MKHVIRFAVALCAAVLAMPGAATAQPNDMRTEVVSIAGGQGQITRRDTIFGRQSIAYQLRADAGQTLAIALYPSNGATYFTVFGPGQAPGGGGMAGSDITGPMVPELNRFRTRLSASGTYTVLVYLYRAAARRGERSDFALDISLSGRGYATQLPEPPGFRPPQPPGGAGAMRVTGVNPGDALNVRLGPSTNYRVLYTLANGDIVRNRGCITNANRREWCEVNPIGQPGRRGWASASYLVAAGLAPRPPLGQPITRTERVTFQGGTSGAELSDTLTPGSSVRYVLGARNGQFLYVRVAARGPGISYQIFNPDNSFLLDQTPASREYRGQLWQSGDHVIEVINRGNTAASYNVIFGIN